MSNRRLKANHRNSKKSTGPRTDPGKSRSSLNAFSGGPASRKPGECNEQEVSPQPSLPPTGVPHPVPTSARSSLPPLRKGATGDFSVSVISFVFPIASSLL